MLGARPLDDRSAPDVFGSRFFLDVHLQKLIRSAKAPETCRPPLGCDLKAFRGRHKSVSKLSRQQNMQRSGGGLEKRWPGYILREKVVILIEEPGKVEIDLWGDQAAIPYLVPQHSFGPKVTIRIEAGEERHSARQGSEKRRDI